MLSVHLFGVFTISLNGQRLNDQLGPSGRQLAAFLLHFRGRSHRREKLVDQFWGHLDPEAARAALNTGLWRLRKILALDQNRSNIVAQGGNIILETSASFSIDTHRFCGSLQQALRLRCELGTNLLPSLEAAIQEYTGPFMDGDDADWILEERERLLSLYVRATYEAMQLYGLQGRYEDAIAAARLILVVDPFRESVVRVLGVLFVLNGQRAEAIRYFDRWKGLFKRELCVDPMPATLRLADDLRSGKIFEHMEALRNEYLSQVGDEDKHYREEPPDRRTRSDRSFVDIAST